MGRTRTPTSILDAKGSFIGKPSRRRRRTKEPISDQPIGSPPIWMSKEEKKVWKELAGQSAPGVLTEPDRLIFAVLVRLSAKFRSNVPMMASETAQMITIASKFAMTPADRSKVSVEQPKKSGLSLFLAERKSA